MSESYQEQHFGRYVREGVVPTYSPQVMSFLRVENYTAILIIPILLGGRGNVESRVCANFRRKHLDSPPLIILASATHD